MSKGRLLHDLINISVVVLFIFLLVSVREVKVGAIFFELGLLVPPVDGLDDTARHT